MSIVIQNVSSDDAPMRGDNNYLIRINNSVICNFKHDRKPGGLSQCLRDAADAVDAVGKNKMDVDRFLSIIAKIK